MKRKSRKMSKKIIERAELNMMQRESEEWEVREGAGGKKMEG